MLFHLSSVIQFSWSSVGGSSAQPQETAGKKLSWMSKFDCIWKVKIVSLFSEWDLNRASTLKISTEKNYLKPRTVLIVPGLLTPKPSSAPLRSVVAVAAAWVYHLRLGKIIHYSWHIRSCRIWTHHLCKISIIAFASNYIIHHSLRKVLQSQHFAISKYFWWSLFWRRTFGHW